MEIYFKKKVDKAQKYMVQHDISAAISANKFATLAKLSKDEAFISVLGDINLGDFSKRGLQIKVNNFNQYHLIPNVQIKEALNQLNNSYLDMEGTLINDEVLINSLDVFQENELKLSVNGEINLSNIQQTFLKINLHRLKSNDLRKLAEYSNQIDFIEYLDLFLFDNMKGNIIVDLSTNSYILENIEITQDERISTISGKIFEEKFSGKINLKQLPSPARLVTTTLPPCLVIIRSTRTKPKPVPAYWRLRLLSIWTKG